MLSLKIRRDIATEAVGDVTWTVLRVIEISETNLSCQARQLECHIEVNDVVLVQDVVCCL